MKKKYRNTSFWVYYNSAKLDSNFAIDEFGWHNAPAGYEFTETRNNAIIQFVYSGVCKLTVWRGKTKNEYNVKAGEAFVIYPGIKQCYVSDENHPSARYWLALSGSHALDILRRCGLTGDKIVATAVDIAKAGKLFEKFRYCTNDRPETVFSIYANAYDILGMFACSNAAVSPSQDYENTNKLLVNSVVAYIENNLSKKLIVEDIAALFGYERSQFYRIFKSEMGMSVQQFLSNQRITRARNLLTETALPLAYIAEQLGYENYSSFSKNFFNRVHTSPSEYRASQRYVPE